MLNLNFSTLCNMSLLLQRRRVCWKESHSTVLPNSFSSPVSFGNMACCEQPVERNNSKCLTSRPTFESYSLTDILLFGFSLNISIKHIAYLRPLVQQQFAWSNLEQLCACSLELCRKRRADTFNAMMPELPREWLAYRDPLFTNTGIDYFGPFFVSNKRSS